MDAELRQRLPELLWLYSLGIVVYWVYAMSPGCARTYGLIDATMPIATRLIAASQLPGLRATLGDITTLINDLSG
jgi:hypothetical protein